MAKKFSSQEIAAMLQAAGFSLESVQQKAALNLQDVVDTSTDSIETNRQVIADAQRSITEATAELNKAKATLAVVKALGG